MDRKLYNFPWSNEYDSGLLFPTPLEVDRYLYGWWWEESDGSHPFPATREVNRVLYFTLH